MSHSTVTFRSGCLRLDLSPDSRDYVLFSLWKQAPDSDDISSPRTSIQRLTCEYIVDVIHVTVQAAKWIEANCEEITYEGRHLYYKFRPEVIELLVEAEPKTID